MDRVGERINQLFEDRKGASQIFLLVSINGQKSYCGLAIMSGPWKATGPGELEGWEEKDEGTKTMGYVVLLSFITFFTDKRPECFQLYGHT